jgi:hypothetical protein
VVSTLYWRDLRMDETQQERHADADLGRQLLRGGVGRRHVRRALRELRDHREDLVARMVATGQEHAAAVRDARQLLGDRAVLAAQMIARPELRSRAQRFAWLLFGLAPLPLFCVVGILAMFAGAAALEVGQLLGLPALSSQHAMAMGRPLLLWIVPGCVGLLLCWLGVRHSVRAFWPIFAMAIVAWCSGVTDVDEHGVAFGMLPLFRSPLPELLRMLTLFCALGVTYLLLRNAEQRRFSNE